MQKILSTFGQFIERTNYFCHLTAGICIGVVGVSYAIAIIARAIGQRIIGSYELNEIMMILIVFLALAYTQQQKRHINADLFSQRLGPIGRPLIHGLVQFFCLIFLIYVTYLSYQYAYTKFLVKDYRVGDINYPVWVLRYIIAFGFSLFSLQLVVDISRNIGEIKQVISIRKLARIK